MSDICGLTVQKYVMLDAFSLKDKTPQTLQLAGFFFFFLFWWPGLESNQ